MKVFWQRDPLIEPQERLLAAVLEAHRDSCFRGNISSHAALLAFAGSSDYSKAIAAAMMSLGGVHAPLRETVLFLMRPMVTSEVERLVRAGRRVPGWGNSFVKGQKDPLWLKVDHALTQDFSEVARVLNQATEKLHSLGKRIFPNPSAYTACAALSLGIPADFAPWLLVAGRLSGWSEILMKGAVS